jgi:hypothetical protein
MENQEELQKFHNTKKYKKYTRRLLNGSYKENRNRYKRNLDEILSKAVNASNKKRANLNFIINKMINGKFNLQPNIKALQAKELFLGNLEGHRQRFNRLASILRRAREQGIPLDNVDVEKTLDDGDCFYSSIYRAAKEQDGVLERIFLMLDPEIDLGKADEELFIQKFRMKVAEEIAKEQEISGDMYDNYVALTEDPETYTLAIESMPRWFIKEFGKKGEKLGDKNHFYERFIHHVVQKGDWVGDTEATIVSRLLLPLNIRIEILYHEVNKLPITEGGHNLLWLYNQGEAHYEYFSFFDVLSSNSSSDNVNTAEQKQKAASQKVLELELELAQLKRNLQNVNKNSNGNSIKSKKSNSKKLEYFPDFNRFSNSNTNGNSKNSKTRKRR